MLKFYFNLYASSLIFFPRAPKTVPDTAPEKGVN